MSQVRWQDVQLRPVLGYGAGDLDALFLEGLHQFLVGERLDIEVLLLTRSLSISLTLVFAVPERHWKPARRVKKYFISSTP